MDFVDQMNPGIMRTMLLIVRNIWGFSTWVFDALTTSINDLIDSVVEAFDFPAVVDTAIDVIQQFMQPIFNLTLIEFLFGSGLITVILIGIVAFFTDVVGL